MPGAEAQPDRRSGARERLARAARSPAVQLYGLYGIAVAQPTLAVVADHVHFLVARRAAPGEIVALALVVCFAGPAALWLGEALVGRLWPRSAAGLHAGLLGLLGALLLQFVAHRGLGMGDAPSLLLGGIAWPLCALGFARIDTLRSFAGLLGAPSLLVPVLFLASAPIAERVVAPHPPLPLHTARADDTPILFVVFDEFPLLSLLDAEQRIDAARAPALARFADDATWYRRATTVGDNTAIAVPAILTGRRAVGRQPPAFAAHPQNLFSLLAPTHRIRAIEYVTDLCPSPVCSRPRGPFHERIGPLLSDVGIVALRRLLPAPLSAGLPPVDDRWLNFARVEAQSSVAQDFERTLAGLEPGQRATLDYLHVLTPHGPWTHLPSGQQYGTSTDLRTPAGLDATHWRREPGFALRALQRHLLEVGYADALFGRLIARLRETRLYDEMLIVVVADHGISFQPGEPWRAVTAQNHLEQIWVPLFVKAPGQTQGRIDDRLVETIDILPTVAELLGITLPWPVDGTSVQGPGDAARTLRAVVRFRDHETLTFAADLPGRRAAVAARIARFGEGDDTRRLYAIGPRPELIGLRVEPGRPAGADAARVWLDRDPGFDSVRLDAPHVPVYLSGRIEGEASVVAIALNGVVQVTAEPFDVNGERRFEALLPLAALREGENALDVLIPLRRAPGTLLPARVEIAGGR